MAEDQTKTQDPPKDPPQDPPKGDPKKGPDPIPYDRFKAVNEENNSLKSRIAALEAAAKEKEDANKSELQKLQEQFSDMNSKWEAAEQKSMKLEVAQLKGIPVNLVDRLQGSTREELEADADSLAAFLKPPGGPGATPPPKGGKPTGFDLEGKSPEEIRKAMAEGKVSLS